MDLVDQGDQEVQVDLVALVDLVAQEDLEDQVV
jgi:hypothetical protein